MYVSAGNMIGLFQQGRKFNYKKEDVIIRSGDMPSGVYYISSGWVKVYSLSKSGEPNIIMTLEVGQIFPIAWAVSGLSRDVSFAALDDTETLRISREEFLQLMSVDKPFSQSVLKMLAEHFMTLASELDNLQYRSAREKVVFRLIFLALHFGKRRGNEATIDIKVPNEYIARSTNMTRETASREISRLVRKQLIRHYEGKIVIPDILKLGHEIDRHFNLDTLSIE